MTGYWNRVYHRSFFPLGSVVILILHANLVNIIKMKRDLLETLFPFIILVKKEKRSEDGMAEN